jgi:hypothetical protein
MTLSATWLIASSRLHNRWLDLRGRLAGYCMATTWRNDTGFGPGYAPGGPHWRCWKKRHLPIEAHRFHNYIWHTDRGSMFDPLPVLVRQAGEPYRIRPGEPPPWGLGPVVGHHAIAPRGKERKMRQYADRQLRLRRGNQQ